MQAFVEPKNATTPLHPIFDSAPYRKLETWLGRASSVGNRPFFEPDQFPWSKDLEANWLIIRQELEQVLQQVDELPNFQDIMPRQQRISPDSGWKTYYFCAFGFIAEGNCEACPKTWELIRHIPGLKVAFFSILAPGKHIPEHRGKHKGLIRYHLGLRVPEPNTACRLRVGEETVHWQDGKSIIFDDTFYHEAWNDTESYRAVLFLDIARPFYFPLSLVNGLVSRLLVLSPLVKQAKANYQHWEQQFARQPSRFS